MNKERLELIYLLVMAIGFVIANIFLRITPQEKMQGITDHIPLVFVMVILIHFYFRRHTLKKRFRTYLEHSPIKSSGYKRNYLIKAFSAGVFYFGEMISIYVIMISIFAIGFGIGGDDFKQLQVWESFASFAVFPFLGQIMAMLLRKDNEDHVKIWENIGEDYLEK